MVIANRNAFIAVLVVESPSALIEPLHEPKVSSLSGILPPACSRPSSFADQRVSLKRRWEPRRNELMSIGFGVADTAAQRKQSQYMESFLRLYTVQGCGLPSMAIKRKKHHYRQQPFTYQPTYLRDLWRTSIWRFVFSLINKTSRQDSSQAQKI